MIIPTSDFLASDHSYTSFLASDFCGVIPTLQYSNYFLLFKVNPIDLAGWTNKNQSRMTLIGMEYYLKNM